MVMGKNQVTGKSKTPFNYTPIDTGEIFPVQNIQPQVAESTFYIKNQWNEQDRSKQDLTEKGGGKSKTSPNQALTVTDIMKRHLSGRPLPAGRTPVYTGGVYMPDLEKYDKVQLSSLAMQIQEEQNRKERELLDKEKELRETEKKELEQLRFEFDKLKKDGETVTVQMKKKEDADG